MRGAAAGARAVPVEAVPVVVGRAGEAAVTAAEVRPVLGVEAGVHLAATGPRPVRATGGAEDDASADGPAVAADIPFAAEAGLVVPVARLAAGVPRLPAPHAEGAVLEVPRAAALAAPRIEAAAPRVLGAPSPAAVDRADGPVPAGVGADPRRAAGGEGA